MSTGGPNTWALPLFGADGVPHLVINGVEIELEMESFDADQVDQTGVHVETSGGQHVAHLLLIAASAPLATPFELNVETKQLSDEIRDLVLLAPALAKGGSLSLWFDRPALDVWKGNGTRTTFVLSQSTGYATTGVTWAQRPARCFVGTTEQTMVTGAPASGECQLSQTTDATSLVLGDAPAAGAIVRLAYYPLFNQGSVEVSESKDGFNSGNISLSFEAKIPVRGYGA